MSGVLHTHACSMTIDAITLSSHPAHTETVRSYQAADRPMLLLCVGVAAAGVHVLCHSDHTPHTRAHRHMEHTTHTTPPSSGVHAHVYGAVCRSCGVYGAVAAMCTCLSVLSPLVPSVAMRLLVVLLVAAASCVSAAPQRIQIFPTRGPAK